MAEKYYKAKYIVEDVKRIHSDSVLIIEDESIKKICKASDLTPVELQKIEDLGEVVVMPGLTNAHSHVALNSVKGLGYGEASALYDVMWGVEP